MFFSYQAGLPKWSTYTWRGHHNVQMGTTEPELSLSVSILRGVDICAGRLTHPAWYLFISSLRSILTSVLYKQSA